MMTRLRLGWLRPRLRVTKAILQLLGSEHAATDLWQVFYECADLVCARVTSNTASLAIPHWGIYAVEIEW